MTVNPQAYLTARKNDTTGAVNEKICEWENWYERKLWHELTLCIYDAIDNMDYFKEPGHMRAVFDDFVMGFTGKLNSHAVARIALKASEYASDVNEDIKFLEGVARNLAKHISALVQVQMRLAERKLSLNDLEGCKQLLEENSERIDEREEIVLSTHATYYLVSAQYHKAKGNFVEYYRDALRFLGCSEIDDISLESQRTYAFDLSLAAIIAETVYNFGELIIHPILQSLKGSEHEWLYDLIHAFNCGDIASFDRLQPKWQTQPELVQNVGHIRQKIMLMTLLEIVFRRATNDRTLHFQVIADACCIPVTDVEKLVMKGLSLKLLRGTIDEITQTVRITWIQPRVLDRNQIGLMTKQLGDWCSRVSSTIDFTEGQHSHEE